MLSLLPQKRSKNETYLCQAITAVFSEPLVQSRVNNYFYSSCISAATACDQWQSGGDIEHLGQHDICPHRKKKMVLNISIICALSACPSIVARPRSIHRIAFLPFPCCTCHNNLNVDTQTLLRDSNDMAGATG